MEKILALIFIKYKVFIYGFLAGAVLQYFEIQAGNVKFNIGKFLVSSCIFGVLAEFSHLLIEGDFLNTSVNNESRVIALSIMIAAFLYLFIPFVLKPENRGRFLESILNRFGFERKNTDIGYINTDIFK